ncbi:MAG TPA: M28 family peptidase [Solirubrobacter sp.]|nr:M28 family peptidase [Solirubrobacter sp.]
MRKTLAVLALGVLGVAPATAVAADPDTTALRNAVNRAEVLRYEQRLQTIAMSNENHRLTASQGNWESVNYVINELRKMGYNPTFLPYANTSAPNSWSEPAATPAVLERISPDPKTYVNNVNLTGDFAQMTWSHSGDVTGQVIPVAGIRIPPVGTADGNRSGCALSDFPAAVKDNIALIQRGTCTHLASTGTTAAAQNAGFLEKIINARAAGAKAVLIFNEGQTNRVAPGLTTNGTTFTRAVSQTYPGIMAATLSYAAGKELYDLAQAGTPATVHFKTDNNINQRIDYDIIAETPNGDPTRVLQVGAHIDGVNAGPGINDDGSGTSMNLAIAHQILKLNLPLKYKIRFGWFSGEEQGLFGSTFAVNQLNTVQTQQTLGMLDYDMIASTNYIPFMYIPNPMETTLPPLQRDSEATMSNVHIDYLQNRLGIPKTDYPFDNRSDYAQWRARNVPATGLFTGAETSKTAAMVPMYGGQAGIQADPCYHEWCDTVFNLSQYGLDEFTDVLAHATLSLAGVGTDAVELPLRPEVLVPAPTPTP